MTNRYARPEYGGAAVLAAALERDDPEELGPLIIGAALDEEDFDIVHAACVRLSSHRDETVRGNATLGFGHIARLFGRIGPEAAAIVTRGLDDPSEYVRGQAWAAADDLEMFVGVKLRDEAP